MVRHGYTSICNVYGDAAYHLTGVAAVLLIAGGAYVAGVGTLVGLAVAEGPLSGATQKVLRRHRVGLTRSNRIFRRLQFASVAVGLLGGVAADVYRKASPEPPPAQVLTSAANPYSLR